MLLKKDPVNDGCRAKFAVSGEAPVGYCLGCLPRDYALLRGCASLLCATTLVIARGGSGGALVLWISTPCASIAWRSISNWLGRVWRSYASKFLALIPQHLLRMVSKKRKERS
ncbi:MAG: hypothetical protein WC641_05560 [Patescibacteria group bacterium]